MNDIKEKITDILDEFNVRFEDHFGYRFCRCYFCIFSIIISKYNECKKNNNYTLLKSLLEDINGDYLASADYKMRKNFKSGLVCGNDCTAYEEKTEACPVTFWEIDKDHFPQLISLLSNEEFVSCFNELEGYNVGECK